MVKMMKKKMIVKNTMKKIKKMIENASIVKNLRHGTVRMACAEDAVIIAIAQDMVENTPQMMIDLKCANFIPSPPYTVIMNYEEIVVKDTTAPISEHDYDVSRYEPRLHLLRLFIRLHNDPYLHKNKIK